jgi:regulator of protease activity HflC (stomatin/prohibitin superfamily)
MTAAIVGGCVAVLLLLLVARAVFVVPHNQAVVIERLGRFRKVAGAGVNIRLPLVDRIRARVDLREQVVAYSPTEMVTSDNRKVSATLRVYAQIVDVRTAVYANANWIFAVEQLAQAMLNNHVGELPQQEALRARASISDSILTALRAEADRWGVVVNSVQLTVSALSAKARRG